MQLHGKNDDVGQPDSPGPKSSTKGYTWFQPKEWQRNALLGISGRSGLWSGKGSIEAPTKGNGQGWEVGRCRVEGHIHGGRWWEEG